jgi:hypothetical protein
MDYCHLRGVIKERQNDHDGKPGDEHNPNLLIDKIEINYIIY